MKDSNRLNSELLGSYLQSFFCIELNTDEPLDQLDKLKEETISTLLHEYIHYLQDITTTFGLNNIISIVNHQKMINNSINESKAQTFQIPIELDDTQISKIQNDLHSIFVGDYVSKFNEFSSIISYEIVSNELVSGYEHHPYVSIKFQHFHDVLEFNFGAIQIIESMAYIIERNMFDKVKSPVYPYHVAEKIIEFIYPNIIGNDPLIVAICHYSLMLPDPGRFFIQFTNDLKERGINSFEHANKLFKHVKIRNEESNETVYSFYEDRLENALISLKDYFTISYFDDIHLWFTKVFERISTFRLENFNFWSELIISKDKVLNRNKLVFLTNKFGLPLIVNNQGQSVFNDPEFEELNNIFSLRAIKEVNEFLSNRQTDCKMLKMCKRSTPNFTSEKCSNPWLRGQEEKLCPFGVIIKMWGISSKVPIKTLNNKP